MSDYWGIDRIYFDGEARWLSPKDADDIIERYPESAYQFWDKFGKQYIPGSRPGLMLESVYSAGKSDFTGAGLASSGKKGYKDLPYVRTAITNRDIVEAVREILQVNEGEAIPLVFDGKVTPVVVLNDSIKYSRYVFKWKKNIDDDFVNLPGTGSFSPIVSNNGFVYLTGWVNMGGTVGLDVNGSIILDTDNMMMTYLNMYGGGSVYIVLYDDVNYPNYVNVYRYGEMLYAIDTRLGVSDVSALDNFVISKNGKYVCICEKSLGDGDYYLCFYEGVV